MILRSDISWSGKQIKKLFDEGLLLFNNVIQRSYRWEAERSSGLIHSILEGYPIPPFYARRIDGKSFDFLDGKQRITSLVRFMDDQFALIGMPIIVRDGNEMDLNGKVFSQLPEELQDIIKDYKFDAYYFDGITDDEVRLMFKKLNNGKPLTVKERNIANCTDLSNLTKMAEHPFFEATLTDKAKETRKQISLLMKMHLMLREEQYNYDTLTFESKEFNTAMEDTETTQEDRNLIGQVLDKAYAILNQLDEKTEKLIRKRFAVETHFIALVPFLRKAVVEGISDQLVADFLRTYYSKKEMVSDAYMQFCRSGSARNTAIVGRHKELINAWESFFSTDTVTVVSVTDAE